MATVQPFTLFPSSVPKISVPNPQSRPRSLHQIHTVTDIPLKTIAAEGGAVVIQIDEQPPLPKIPKNNFELAFRTPSPQHIGRAVTTPSTAVPQKDAETADTSKQTSIVSPRSPRSGSATLVQDPTAETPTKSPVVPIRSMFPTFNPSVTLHQQNYYPQRPFPTRLSSLHGTPVSREDYRDNWSNPLDRSVGLRTAPTSVVNFPLDGISVLEPQYSSNRDLEKLWDASHGAEPNQTIKSFNLEMTRTSEAIFSFGCDPGFPFYTLKTYDTSEFAVSKTCPRKRSMNPDVVLSSLEPGYRRIAPNDGLVTFIFPKMAAMLAIDQSANLTKQHQLAPTDRDDVEAAAVKRAAQQEACYVRWIEQDRRYELEHPAIGRNRRDPEFIDSASSPRPAEGVRPVLHITISSTSNDIDSPLAPRTSAPVILVTDPNTSLSPNTAAGGGNRLSTLPQSDVDTPLASLDFGSSTLHIDANQILQLMPSLFAIDSIVSAMLAVAVADDITNPIMGAMEIWTPRPKAPASVFGGSVKSYAGSAFYTTIAEREEAEEQAKLMRKEHEKDVKKNKNAGEVQRNWYGKTKKTKSKKKQILIGEFDLEKLGHYQSGERKGQELPGVTRSALAGLVVGLRFVVWLLTVVAQFLAWILVNVSRAVTSEKF